MLIFLRIGSGRKDFDHFCVNCPGISSRFFYTENQMKKVAIQGIAGSFHEDAARRYFHEDIEIIECKSFKRVCDLIDQDKVDVAVMAIENSIAGSLLNNYALIREYHLKIFGEIYIHIQMNLLANEKVKFKDVDQVYSHPIAIKQCAEFIEQNLPKAEVFEKMDTAASAKFIKENELKNAVAIGNLRSAELYGLKVLETGIETNKKNYTRFLMLDKHGNADKNNDKASLCFEVGHYYGALAKVLNTFAENEINLTKIQSVPIIGRPNEYSFHVDIEWDKTENYERSIHSILKHVSSLSILGEYKQGKTAIHNQ